MFKELGILSVTGCWDIIAGETRKVEVDAER